MVKVVYGSGSVTVAVDGTLERTLRDAVRAASRGIADSIEALVDEVSDDAKTDWYEQVDKRTGKSQASITPEMRITTDKVTGVVYATQKATYMIRRPGPLSTLSSRRVADPREYFEVRDYYRKNGRMPEGYTYARLEDGDPVGVRKTRPNPKASDGKSMWVENVLKPGRKLVTKNVRSIEKAAKKAVKGVSRG
jgi:hypothetical protein